MQRRRGDIQAEITAMQRRLHAFQFYKRARNEVAKKYKPREEKSSGHGEPEVPGSHSRCWAEGGMIRVAVLSELQCGGHTGGAGWRAITGCPPLQPWPQEAILRPRCRGCGFMRMWVKRGDKSASNNVLPHQACGSGRVSPDGHL